MAIGENVLQSLRSWSGIGGDSQQDPYAGAQPDSAGFDRGLDDAVNIENTAKAAEMQNMNNRNMWLCRLADSAHRNGGLSHPSLAQAASTDLGQRVYGMQYLSGLKGADAKHNGSYAVYGDKPDGSGIGVVGLVSPQTILQTFQRMGAGSRNAGLMRQAWNDMGGARYTPEQLAKMGVTNPDAPEEVNPHATTQNTRQILGRIFGKERTERGISTFASDGRGGWTSRDKDGNVTEGGTRAVSDNDNIKYWQEISYGPNGGEYANTVTGERIRTAPGENLRDALKPDAAKNRQLNKLTQAQLAEAGKNGRADAANEIKRQQMYIGSIDKSISNYKDLESKEMDPAKKAAYAEERKRLETARNVMVGIFDDSNAASGNGGSAAPTGSIDSILNAAASEQKGGKSGVPSAKADKDDKIREIWAELNNVKNNKSGNFVPREEAEAEYERRYGKAAAQDEGKSVAKTADENDGIEPLDESVFESEKAKAPASVGSGSPATDKAAGSGAEKKPDDLMSRYAAFKKEYKPGKLQSEHQRRQEFYRVARKHNLSEDEIRKIEKDEKNAMLAKRSDESGRLDAERQEVLGNRQKLRDANAAFKNDPVTQKDLANLRGAKEIEARRQADEARRSAVPDMMEGHEDYSGSAEVDDLDAKFAEVIGGRNVSWADFAKKVRAIVDSVKPGSFLGGELDKELKDSRERAKYRKELEKLRDGLEEYRGNVTDERREKYAMALVGLRDKLRAAKAKRAR